MVNGKKTFIPVRQKQSGQAVLSQINNFKIFSKKETQMQMFDNKNGTWTIYAFDERFTGSFHDCLDWYEKQS